MGSEHGKCLILSGADIPVLEKKSVVQTLLKRVSSLEPWAIKLIACPLLQ